MAKAYLCPHCQARNRFDPTDAKEGVVRCGACGKAFMLPDFAQDHDSAPVDTAIVDVRAEEGPAAGGGRPPLVAGSNVPTLLVHDHVPVRMGSETPTVLSTDALVPGEFPTAPDARAVPPGNGGDDTLVDSLRVPEEPPPPPPPPAIPALHSAETVRPSEVPPPSVIAEESPRSTAATQPTNPPPEYVARLEEKLPDSVLASTQPAVLPPDPIRAFGITVASFAVAAIVLGGFYVAGMRADTQAEVALMQWSVDQGAARAGAVVDAVSSVMTAGRPDLAHRLASRLDSGVFVVDEQGRRAFVDGDWTTYRTVLSAVCDQTGLQKRVTGLPGAAAALPRAWLAGGDPRVAGLGPSPCAAIDSLPVGAIVVESGIAGRLGDRIGADGSGMSWVEDGKSGRVQVVARPFDRAPRCVGCHGASDRPLGYAVVRSDLGPLDGESRRILLVTGAFAAGLAVLVLLGFLRLFGRPGGELV